MWVTTIFSLFCWILFLAFQILFASSLYPAWLSDHKTRQNGEKFFTPNYNIVPSWSNKQHTLSFHKMFLFPKQIYVLKKSLEITYESKFSILSFLFLTNKKVLINLGRVLISYQKKRFIIAGLTVFFKIIPKKAENLVNRLD